MTEGAYLAEVDQLRRLYEQEQARVRELEAAQRQLEMYAEDLQRMFRELRRQLTHMNELHTISTMIGSILDPNEVMARTLEGLTRLVEYDVACIYLVTGSVAERHATHGRLDIAPPETARLGEGSLGRVLAGTEATAQGADGQSLTVPMRVGGSVVGALHLVRRNGEPIGADECKLVQLVAAEAAGAIQNARLYEQTQRLATTDPLTSLFNYRYLQDALRMEAARARRLGYSVGLLMIDIDNFKRINDTYGHLVGDQVLRDIAAVLQRNLRRTDIVARYGGEEFAVILPGLGNGGVRAVGEKLRRAVDALRPLMQDGREPTPVTVSIGGVSRAASEVEPVGLVRDADAALYQAKREGKNCVFVQAAEPSQGRTRPRRQEHAQAHRAPR